MKYLLSILLLFIHLLSVVGQNNNTIDNETRRIREEFLDRKFGIFLHWGIYSMLADGEWVMHNRSLDRNEYAKLAGGFYPSLFDAHEWTKLFKEAGAQYVTFTSRHHDGFSMWATKASSYNIVDATPFKRDIIGELAEACKEQKLKLQFYYSHMDWQRTDYPMGRCRSCPHDSATTNWKTYFAFMNKQLTELLTNYGPIGAIWFDGMWDHPEKEFDWQLDEQYALIKSLQPTCMIGNNHHGSPIGVEDFQLFEQDLPGQNTAGFSGEQKISQLPLETCMTMNNTWGYSITDKNYKSGDELIRRLVTAAGLNANFLLNIGPRPDGKLPDQAVEILKHIGTFMKTNGETIYETRGGCVPPQAWGVTTQKGKKLYIHILHKVENGQIFLPLTTRSITKVVSYHSKAKMKIQQEEGGYRIFLPEQPDMVDFILCATLK